MKHILPFFFGGLFSLWTYAQNSSGLTPGVLESIDSLIEIDSKTARIIQQKYQSAPLIESRVQLPEKVESLEIDPLFLQSTLFNSPQAYFKDKDTNRCNFYQLMWFGLLQSSLGEVKQVPVLRTTKNKAIKQWISSKTLAEFLSIKNCDTNISLFKQVNNLSFSELKKEFPISYPKGVAECKQTHGTINKSYLRNYLLYLAKKIRESQVALISERRDNETRKIIIKGQKIEKSFTLKEREVLKAFFNYTESSQKFCDSLFDKSFFSEAKRNPLDYSHILNPICQGHLKKFSTLNVDNYISCIDDIKKSDHICLKANSLHNPSLFPQLLCRKLISNSLNSSFTRFGSDCPASIYNEGIINAGRVLHFYKESKESLVYNRESPSCLTYPVLSFINFSEDMGLSTAWKTQACYYNQVTQKESCEKILFINSQSLDFSVNNVISRILHFTKKVKNKPKCYFLSDSEVGKMNLLKRKGCFISYNTKTCKLDNCKFDIYLNERKLDSFITIKSNSSFHYIPSNFSKKQFSFQNILKRKFNLKESKIYNLTQLQQVSSRKKAIIHGIGCAEDLIPDLFRRRTINECKPLPFIISGTKKRKESLTDEVIVNLSIDSLNIARGYEWKTIYATIKNYQDNHPTRYWSLYAVYK